MAWRCGSLSRSLFSTARSSTLRSRPPSLPHLRPPSTSTSRHFSCAPPRNFGEIGCTQSFLPFFSGAMAVPRLTSHLSVEARACCELYHGTFRRTCQDR